MGPHHHHPPPPPRHCRRPPWFLRRHLPRSPHHHRSSPPSERTRPRSDTRAQSPPAYKPHLIARIENGYHMTTADGWLVCHFHSCERSFSLGNNAALQSYANRVVFDECCWQTFLCDEHKILPVELQGQQFCHCCMACEPSAVIQHYDCCNGRFHVRLCSDCALLSHSQRRRGAMDRRRPGRRRKRSVSSAADGSDTGGGATHGDDYLDEPHREEMQRDALCNNHAGEE